MADKIGFIGLGAMGRPMASNLVAKGHEVTVFDLEPKAMAALVAKGAKAAGSLAELIGAVDVIITMLPNSPEVEEVLCGDGAVFPQRKADDEQPEQLVIDMSTIDPAATDRIAEYLRDKGVGFIDAPVGRTVTQAEKGESLFMVGAHDNDLGRARLVLEAMGTTIHHCGPPGSGIRTKLVNNFLAIASCQLSAEAFALAQGFGLDLQTTLAVVNGTTATNGHLKIMWPIKVLAGDTAPGFRIALAHKDLALAMNAASDLGVPVPMGAAAREALSLAKKHGDYGNRDFSALLDLACEQSGFKKMRLS